MSASKLLDSLPQLVDEGLITAEQSDRIRTRYSTDATRSGNRMLLVFSILGSLLVGMGIILIVAHNWDDLPRLVRTLLAFIPMLLGQGSVWYSIQRKTGDPAWREGAAVFLACGLCACIALISQIYHMGGDLEGYLLTCALLIAPLLYVPGSVIVGICYLALITWYGSIFRFEHGNDRPWLLLFLLAAAVPFYLRQARISGMSVGFWWISLCMALTLGISSQLFYTALETEHTLGLMALAAAFTLVPWLHAGRSLRTWPWVIVGGASTFIVFCIFSFRDMWRNAHHLADTGIKQDLPWIIALCVTGIASYMLSLKKRKPFEGYAYPEGWWLFLICYLVSFVSPIAATILVNLSLLVMGVVTVKHGIASDSLRRMNLGLTILSATLLMRFFDTEMGFLLRGGLFIGIGCGFLFLNLRMVRQREKARSIEQGGSHAA